MRTDPSTDTSTGSHGRHPRAASRPILWALLALSTTANVAASASALPAAVGAAFGVLALTFIVLLVLDHRRRHRLTWSCPRPWS